MNSLHLEVTSSNSSSAAGPWCILRLYAAAVAAGGRGRNLFLLSKLLLKLLRRICKKHCRHSELEAVLYLDTNNVFLDKKKKKRKKREKYLRYETSITKRGEGKNPYYSKLRICLS